MQHIHRSNHWALGSRISHSEYISLRYSTRRLCTDLTVLTPHELRTCSQTLSCVVHMDSIQCHKPEACYTELCGSFFNSTGLRMVTPSHSGSLGSSSHKAFWQAHCRIMHGNTTCPLMSSASSSPLFLSTDTRRITTMQLWRRRRANWTML